MPTGGIVLASGTRVSIDYVRECVHGEQPSSLDERIPNIGLDPTGTDAFIFTRASGSWITDGFLVGDTVRAYGFTDGNVNAVWTVEAVTATDLTVTDTGDTITGAETASADRMVTRRLSSNIEAVAAGTQGSGYSIFRRASGSWVDEGYQVGQHVTSEDFTTGANNGTWVVSLISALDLEVEDPADDVADEAADPQQSVYINVNRLRTTQRNVNPEKDLLESEEVRPSRQRSDVRHGFNRVTGTLGFELSREAYDDWLEHAMSEFWGANDPATTGSPDLEVDVDPPGSGAADVIRDAGSWSDDGYRPGDIVDLAGFATGVNNRRARILSIETTSTADDTLRVYDPSDVMVDDASATGPTVTYVGQRLDIGVELLTTTLQRRFDDVLQYQVFHGCAVDQWQQQVQPTAIVGGSFNILGMSFDTLRTHPIGGASAIAAAANEPFAAFDGTLFENALLIAVVTGIDFTLANNRALEAVVGSRFSPDVFEGDAVINGTLTAFFQDQVLLNKFVDETLSSIWFRNDDPDGTNFMSFNFPRVKYNGGNMDPPQRGPVPLSMPFQALESQENGPGSTTVSTSMFLQKSNA